MTSRPSTKRLCTKNDNTSKVLSNLFAKWYTRYKLILVNWTIQKRGKWDPSVNLVNEGFLVWTTLISTWTNRWVAHLIAFRFQFGVNNELNSCVSQAYIANCNKNGHQIKPAMVYCGIVGLWHELIEFIPAHLVTVSVKFSNSSLRCVTRERGRVCYDAAILKQVSQFQINFHEICCFEN